MIDSRLNKFIDTALPISVRLTRPKKHVSLIVNKGNVISCGTNDFRTHPLAKQYGYRFDEVHSELDALLKLPKGASKDGLDLINFRFNRFGDMRISKPCNLCIPWCTAIFDRIWYSTNDGMKRLC